MYIFFWHFHFTANPSVSPVPPCFPDSFKKFAAAASQTAEATSTDLAKRRHAESMGWMFSQQPLPAELALEVHLCLRLPPLTEVWTRALAAAAHKLGIIEMDEDRTANEKEVRLVKSKSKDGRISPAGQEKPHGSSSLFQSETSSIHRRLQELLRWDRVHCYAHESTRNSAETHTHTHGQVGSLPAPNMCSQGRQGRGYVRHIS